MRNAALMIALAPLLLSGLFIPYSRATATLGRVELGKADSAFLLTMADSGNAAAQALLGEMHLTGRGAAKDYAAALECLRAAAEQGDADAQRNLGMMYEAGLGGERDPLLAAKWYGRAMKQGDPFSAYKNGCSYTGEANIP